MTALEIVLGILLLAAAVFLIVAVLMQSGKAKNLSGAIAGGADTFFGKTKGTTIDKKLSKLTTAVAVAFVVLVIVAYVAQKNGTEGKTNTDYISGETTATETTAADAETSANAADTLTTTAAQ